jgi:cysteine synthase A
VKPRLAKPVARNPGWEDGYLQTQIKGEFMANIFRDNAASIGRTPLVRLNRLAAGTSATVLAKVEGRSPAYSVKDRIGAAMVWDAEQRGVLKPGV